MSNSCDNRITVEGSAEEMAALLAALRSGQAGADLLRLIPPEDLPYELDDFAECGVFDFDSRWSPAVYISEELSQAFPGLTFRHEYEESGSEFSGYEVYQGGVLIDSAHGAYGEYRMSGEYSMDDEE